MCHKLIFGIPIPGIEILSWNEMFQQQASSVYIMFQRENLADCKEDYRVKNKSVARKMLLNSTQHC